MKRGVLFLSLLAGAVLFGALSASAVRAQGIARQQRKLQITDADSAAAAAATEVYHHVLTANTDAGKSAKRDDSAMADRAKAFAGHSSQRRGFERDDHLQFPGDLSNFLGGPTVPFAESHPIFLISPDGTTCPANTCWGDPDTFLSDFGRSDLSHITDQYVGQHADNRYTLGDEFVLPFTPTPAPLLDANIRAIVHAAALLSGESGLNHVFHVFLPPGQDECRTAALTRCYSPDAPGVFVFCAYHSAVTFQDVGQVLYSVEPFQNVGACNVRPGTPNGQTVDSTNSTLSHELIETITDPEGNAWFNVTANDLFGEEIADECSLVAIIDDGSGNLSFFSDVTEFRVGRHRYATQPEWSNEDHGCTIRP